MESLKSLHDRIRNVQSQGKKIAEARVALNTQFDQEETRQKREDEASILTTVRCAIVEQLQDLKRIETSASLGHSQGNLILFPIGLALTAMFSKNNWQSAITDYLLHGSAVRQQPFGTVMVRVGPKGLPQDVKAVSISQLARDSNRLEPEIVNGLRENGYLVFSEEVFSFLIDRLIACIRQGKLCLPVSRERVAEISALDRPKSRIKIVPIE